MKKRVVFILLAGLVLAAWGAAYGVSVWEKKQVETFGTSTLKGLDAVAVVVKVARDREETVQALRDDELRGEVELILQNAGLRIAPPTAEVGLYVVIAQVSRGGKDGMSCAINVQSSLLQIVHLSRDTSIRAEAPTWPHVGQGRFGLVSIAVAQTMIKESVKDQAKEFALDWRAANPR